MKNLSATSSVLLRPAGGASSTSPVSSLCKRLRQYSPCFILTALLIQPTGLFAESARQELKKGAQCYTEKNFSEAGAAFDRAAQQAGKEKLDPAVAFYDQANAFCQSGQFDQALPLYLQALKSPDLALQSHAYFNRGNALMGLSTQLEQSQKLDEAVKSVDEALNMYENSMALASKDMDAKVNYELALKKKEELKQQQQQQQQNQQQNQDKQNQQQQDQQKQDQQQQNQQDQQQEQQDQQQQEQEKKENPDQQQQGNPDKQQQQQDEKQKPAQPEQFEEMTKEEAQMVLDSMKEDEQAQRDPRLLMRGDQVPVDKDW